jgi:hypothetical protein
MHTFHIYKNSVPTSLCSQHTSNTHTIQRVSTTPCTLTQVLASLGMEPGSGLLGALCRAAGRCSHNALCPYSVSCSLFTLCLHTCPQSRLGVCDKQEFRTLQSVCLSDLGHVTQWAASLWVAVSPPLRVQWLVAFAQDGGPPWLCPGVAALLRVQI